MIWYSPEVRTTYSAACVLAVAVDAASTASVAACSSAADIDPCRKTELMCVEQRSGAAGLLHERRQVHRCALVDGAIQNRVHDVGPISGRLRGVNLKLRPEQSALDAILRREVAKHAGRIEQTLAEFAKCRCKWRYWR